jgi:hypothetical protein
MSRARAGSSEAEASLPLRLVQAGCSGAIHVVTINHILIALSLRLSGSILGWQCRTRMDRGDLDLTQPVPVLERPSTPLASSAGRGRAASTAACWRSPRRG